MAMTLRLTNEEHEALRERASRVGISMQEVARRAMREYVATGERFDRGHTAAALVMRQPRRRVAAAR